MVDESNELPDLSFLFEDYFSEIESPDETIDLSSIPFDDLLTQSDMQISTSASNSSPQTNSTKYSSESQPSDEDFDHIEFIDAVKGQKLYLSDEERYLLSRENVKIPTKLPLTRMEDRALRGVRRRIRNKLSAKASRARKQEHVVELEKRLNHFESENNKLHLRVESLRKSNRGLVSMVRRLQEKVSNFSGISSYCNRTDIKTRFASSKVNSVIGRHALTSRHDAQEAFLPRWKNEQLPDKLHPDSRPSGTYLMMVAFVCILAISPVFSTISQYALSKSVATPRRDLTHAATSRVLLNYGPKTLEEFNRELNDGNQDSAQIRISADTLEAVNSVNSPDINKTYDKAKLGTKSIPLPGVIAAG
ncbi:hypothetical protein Ciccas_009488 [Cichlidogyrus casuarinus]|uniref:BZIP domain-containing protein n=1 Tax=Cichlidogyrus casuarinus TaxID=1844966 RepID=A0ABD2PWW8_9PLAT